MSAPGYADSPQNVTKYLGQSYRFAPVYIRNRDPHNGTDGTPFTSPDIRPKENQGYYPIGSFWINTTLNRLWGCTSYGVDANSKTCAHWEIMESAGITGTEQFNLPDTSTITPTGIPPGVTFQNGAGISITQGSDVHSILITNTGSGTETLTGNDGTPISPTLGTIRLFGNVVGAGTQASAILTASGGGNLENINVQVSSAIAATDRTKVGFAAFSNAQFGVDANGFVTLKGGATPPTLGLTPDASTPPGTSPIVPDGSGNIKIEGGALFNTGTQANPIRTNSLAANTLDLQIQKAGSNAAALTANNFGVSQFDSNQFTVSNGFVQINGGGTTGAITKVALDTGTTPIVPSSGQITLTGGQVAAGTTTNVIQTNGTGANTGTIQIQRAKADSTSTVGDNGVCHFDSGRFTVDTNAFVSLPAMAGPQVQNLGISLSAGTFTINDSIGGALSATNYATVTLASFANPGRFKTYKITANESFKDFSTGASQIAGNSFGVVCVNLPDFIYNVPFYIYAASNANAGENAATFFISRVPHMNVMPLAALIAPLGSTGASTQASMFALTAVTAADYASAPCVCIGAFRMTPSAVVGANISDWTVFTLQNGQDFTQPRGADGIGYFHENTVFTMPQSSFQAIASSYFVNTGATPPTIPPGAFFYNVTRAGVANISMGFQGGTAGGAGANVAAIALPYKTGYLSTNNFPVNLNSTPYFGYGIANSGGQSVALTYLNAGVVTNLTNGAITGNCVFQTNISYSIATS